MVNSIRLIYEPIRLNYVEAREFVIFILPRAANPQGSALAGRENAARIAGFGGRPGSTRHHFWLAGLRVFLYIL